MQIERDHSKEFEKISEAYEKSGGDVSNLLSKDIVSIIVSGNQVIGRNTVEGVDIKADVKDNTVVLYLDIHDDIKLSKPVHLCVGYLKDFGEQYVRFHINVGKNSKVNFISHCSFPSAKEIKHDSIAYINIDENSSVNYEDVHFHSESGLVNLSTNYFTKVGKNSLFDNRFKLTKTRVGKMSVNMTVDLDEQAKTLIETKVKTKKDDKIDINEIINLNGKYSSGIAKTYVIAQDESTAKVVNEAYGNGDYSTGHIECTEIVNGNKVDVQTIPLLRVKNELSELTHEASVGRINSGQLETLMAKGLDEEEATELIIKGVLV